MSIIGDQIKPGKPGHVSDVFRTGKGEYTAKCSCGWVSRVFLSAYLADCSARGHRGAKRRTGSTLG